MLWGIKNGEKIQATPKERATCELCGKEVIAKCGEIKVWHFAHKQDFECDSFGEQETEWHREWKNYFPKEQQEVIIEHPIFFEDGCTFPKKHRADIQTKESLIIELQNSPISPQEIKEREEFYGNMVWILNGIKLCSGLRFRKNKGNNNLTFRWKSPPKSWWFAKKNIYVDLNFIPIDGIELINIEKLTDIQKEFWKEYAQKRKLFLIKRVYGNIPCGGYGVLINKEDFINGRRT